MCGIAGFLIARNERFDTARLTRVLHNGIDPRGGDATGAAWADRDGNVNHFTVVGRAQSFRSTHPNAAHDARLAILHTRMATQGKKENPLNNHPIRSGHFLGVHNGHLNNDDELFASLPVPRYGQVDSEAAIALIRYANMKGEAVYTALERLQGRAALAWIDDRDPETLHLARAYGSPLAVAMTERGSVFFASTMTILLGALKAMDIEPAYTQDVKEGTYLRFNNGRLAEVASFKVDEGRKWWSTGGWDWEGDAPTRRTYARDTFEHEVLGYPKRPKQRKAAPGVKSARESARTLALAPYPQETYDVAFSDEEFERSVEYAEAMGRFRLHSVVDRPQGNDPALWIDPTDDVDYAEVEARIAEAEAVAGGAMYWDDDDLLHVGLLAIGAGPDPDAEQ